MVNFPGRNNRRRRVLKEEVLSASSSRASRRDADADDAGEDAPRYSEAAGVENHPQVTDFIPRRYGTIALLGLFGAGTTAVASALHYFVLPIATSRGMTSATALDLTSRGNVTAWLAGIVMFVASGFCVMTYMLRKHRIDDYRGRYRVWLGAALACLVLSANSVTGLHEMLADVLTRVTGWSMLRDGAIWWMALAGLPLAWIFARVMLDVRECRVAIASMAGAAICYAVSAANYVGYGPAAEASVQPVLTWAPLLMGHWLVFTAVVANARFVVLDAQGLITRRSAAEEKRSTASTTAKTVASKTTQATAAASSTSSTVSLSRQTVQTVKTPADSSRWVDGSRPEREHYGDDEDEDSSDGDRKLSKSERKQLRKMKTQGRAA